MTFRGIVWCNRCGAFGSEAARKLLRPCLPPTAAGESHLHALRLLRPPTKKFQWPVDELGRERQVQAQYSHHRTRLQSAALRAKRRAAKRRKLSKGGVSARAFADRGVAKRKRRTAWATQHGGKASRQGNHAQDEDDQPAATPTNTANAKGKKRAAAAAAGPATTPRRRRATPAQAAAPTRGRKRRAATPATPGQRARAAPRTPAPAAALAATAATTEAQGTTAAAAEQTPPTLSAAADRLAAMRARVLAKQAARTAEAQA